MIISSTNCRWQVIRASVSFQLVLCQHSVDMTTWRDVFFPLQEYYVQDKSSNWVFMYILRQNVRERKFWMVIVSWFLLLIAKPWIVGWISTKDK